MATDTLDAGTAPANELRRSPSETAQQHADRLLEAYRAGLITKGEMDGAADPMQRAQEAAGRIFDMSGRASARLLRDALECRLNAPEPKAAPTGPVAIDGDVLWKVTQSLENASYRFSGMHALAKAIDHHFEEVRGLVKMFPTLGTDNTQRWISDG